VALKLVFWALSLIECVKTFITTVFTAFQSKNIRHNKLRMEQKIGA
jgi:hypothetical protein